MSELLSDPFLNASPVLVANGLTSGTLIETATGNRAIDSLKLGDLIETLDDGLQPLRSISRQTMLGKGGTAPIRISIGVVGNEKPLLLAPQHRVLISGWQAELYFGQDEVLVEARSLVNGTTVTCEDVTHIEYICLGFDEHQIIFAHDAQVESDLPHQALSLQHAIGPRGVVMPGHLLARPAVEGNQAQLLSR